MEVLTDPLKILQIEKYKKKYENLKSKMRLLLKLYTKLKSNTYPIYISTQSLAGTGVFALFDIKEGYVIERCPYLEIALDKISEPITNYVFKSHNSNENASLLLGYGSLYNHQDNPNASYFHELINGRDMFVICANRFIPKDTEIFINYGKSYWENRETLKI